MKEDSKLKWLDTYHKNDPREEKKLKLTFWLQVHEVVVENDDPCSVLTWDFDVMRQDIGFTVFKTNAALPSIEGEDKGNPHLIIFLPYYHF